MGTLDLTIGCLLIASWANLMLFALEIVEITKYFKRYPTDLWFNKASVICAFITDVVTVCLVCATCYLYMVTHWGSEEYIATQPWCIPVYVFCTAVGATIVQVWLTRMLFNLTRQWFWLPIIAIFILTGLVGGAATSTQLFLNPSYTERIALVRYVTIWLSGSAAADVIITAILVWKFRSIKTSFTGTKDLLRRLSIASVRNGSITTVMTLITVVVFKSQPEANTATMIEMTIGRIYTLSMLSNLNNRAFLTGDSQGSSGVRKTGADNGQTTTVVRIRQDVETHYQTDADAIPMGNTAYGGKSKHDLESQSGDATSERDVGLPVVVSVRQEKHYDPGF